MATRLRREPTSNGDARLSPVVRPLLAALFSALVVGIGSYVSLIERSVSKDDLRTAISQVTEAESRYIAQLNEQLEKQNSLIEELDNNIDALTSRQNDDSVDITKLEDMIDTLSQRVAELEIQVRLLQNNLAPLRR